ncbi:MAG: LysM peptidoglycan-binding domain-containing protein [Leptolyngbya sp. PLA1]|nr:LysM peptidoglycan-binding domain-containing protein [Leptolyngbya sp. PLA1]
MALPSQSERSTSNRPVMTRASANGRKPMMIAVGLVLAAGAIYGLWAFMPSGEKSPSEVGPSKLADAGAKKPAPAPAQPIQQPAVQPTPAKIEPGPVVLRQGSGGGVVTPPGAGTGTSPGTSPGTAPTGTPTIGAPVNQPDPSKPSPVDVGSPDLRPQPATTPGTNPTTTGTGQPGTTPMNPLAPSGSTSEVRTLIAEADKANAEGKPLVARAAYSRALTHPGAGPTEQAEVREKAARLNETLVFGPTVVTGDPMTEMYVVAANDNLVKIARKRSLETDWRLIQRINKLPDPNSLRVGQKLKLVRGPFHVVVHKSEYRLDLFQGSPDEPERWTYVKSFRVGLGESNGTPTGTFVIKKNSKLVDPPWVNPRTGEKFAANDPKNPIGEHWLGWQGVGDAAIYKGFGLHGTIEPESIGQQRSMGCVRMLPEDIATVYEFLTEEVSVVKVLP